MVGFASALLQSPFNRRFASGSISLLERGRYHRRQSHAERQGGLIVRGSQCKEGCFEELCGAFPSLCSSTAAAFAGSHTLE